MRKKQLRDTNLRRSRFTPPRHQERRPFWLSFLEEIVAVGVGVGHLDVFPEPISAHPVRYGIVASAEIEWSIDTDRHQAAGSHDSGRGEQAGEAGE